MRTRTAHAWRAAGLLLAVLAAVPAAAQQAASANDPANPEPETRAEYLRLERNAKSEALTPPKPGRLERLLLALENDRVLERLLNPAEGLYPKIGNLAPGSGFAVGPAYRRPGLFGGHAEVSTFALGSIKRYWMLDASLRFPRLAGERVFVDLNVRRSEFPQEDFFGLGAASRRQDHVLYALKSSTIGAGAGVKPVPWLSVVGRMEYLTPTIGAPGDGRPIDQLFTAANTPGLGSQPDFVRYQAAADLNYRTPRGNPRRGGRYIVTFEQYDDRDLDRYSFRRVEAELQQYISLLRDRRVLALRARAAVADTEPGQQVPFYLQNALGGPNDLRGFHPFRFRDINALLFQAEYRWEIFTAVDGALFYDAGKVAAQITDLGLKGMESDYGIGFRFGSVNGVFLRVEGAFGSRGGAHFIFRFDHVF